MTQMGKYVKVYPSLTGFPPGQNSNININEVFININQELPSAVDRPALPVLLAAAARDSAKQHCYGTRLS